MMKPRYLIIFAIIVILFISGELFSSFKLRMAASMSDAINFFVPNHELKSRIKELELENENLKVDIFNESITEPNKYKVHSTHPFNNSNKIAIAAGKNNNVEEGDIVTAGDSLLIGRINKVFNNYSIATTIHDPEWEMTVRIGSSEADGIFKGGNRLSIDLIPANSFIEEEDIVISAGVGFPYGLSVGKIKMISSDATGQFKTAIIEPVININELRDVSIRSK